MKGLKMERGHKIEKVLPGSIGEELELEKGDIPLEKSVELYGEGVKLSALCKNQLDNAKIKITEVK